MPSEYQRLLFRLCNQALFCSVESTDRRCDSYAGDSRVFEVMFLSLSRNSAVSTFPKRACASRTKSSRLGASPPYWKKPSSSGKISWKRIHPGRLQQLTLVFNLRLSIQISHAGGISKQRFIKRRENRAFSFYTRSTFGQVVAADNDIL